MTAAVGQSCVLRILCFLSVAVEASSNETTMSVLTSVSGGRQCPGFIKCLISGGGVEGVELPYDLEWEGDCLPNDWGVRAIWREEFPTCINSAAQHEGEKSHTTGLFGKTQRRKVRHHL